MQRRPGGWAYPTAQTVDQVDSYHGTLVADPYRWLEDDGSPECVAWQEAQQRLTRGLLDASPVREQVRARLTAIWDYPKYDVPYWRGRRRFFTKNDGLQNQAVLYTQSGPDAEPTVLLDPNALSADGTVALTAQAASEDGSMLVYGLSAAPDSGPILLRVEKKAGHGMGKPTSKVIDELSDMYAFLEGVCSS